MRCPTCHGHGGWVDEGEPSICDDCGGSGKMKDQFYFIIYLTAPGDRWGTAIAGCKEQAVQEMDRLRALYPQVEFVRVIVGRELTVVEEHRVTYSLKEKE